MIWICLTILCLLTVPQVKYNLRQTNYQFKIRFARTNVLKFSSFFRIVKSWNSLPLHLRKTESLDDFKDCLKSFLHMKDISTFSSFTFLTILMVRTWFPQSPQCCKREIKPSKNSLAFGISKTIRSHLEFQLVFSFSAPLGNRNY